MKKRRIERNTLAHDLHYSACLSSFISSRNKTKAKITMMTNRVTPPRGFITNQLIIGVITYAVINKAAKNMIMRSKRIVKMSPTLFHLYLIFWESSLRHLKLLKED